MRRNFRIKIAGDDPVAELSERITKQIKKAKPGMYRVVIESVGDDDTSIKNRYYWAILNEIAEQTGNDNENMHEHFKARFLQDHSYTPARIRSTTELNVLEFTNYINQILALMADFGITITCTREF